MSVLDRARQLTAAGRQAEAVALVNEAATAGDAEALFAVANWRLFALHGPRDLAAAHRLLERAGAAGHVEAIRTRATLIGNGTGCKADGAKAASLLRSIADRDVYARLQLEFSGRMAPASGFRADAGPVLSTRPLVRTVPGLLTREECNYLIQLGQPNLQPSFVTNPQTGERIPHPVRTSTGMSFGPTQEDRVIRRINERIAKVSGTRVECGEPLHILRYEPGQEYKPHVDGFAGEPNQRDWTVLVYLNEGYGGGATEFDLAGVSFAGRTGDALIFRNVDETGGPDPMSRHAGLPVTAGVKWLATRWIRRRPYHPWVQR